MIRVNTVQCPKCKDIIFSRCSHDFHYCSCHSVSIDGGFDYLHFGWEPDINVGDIICSNRMIESTKEELYNDWNKSINKFGVIETKPKEDKRWKKKK